MAASTYFAQVQQLYIAYFGRPADTTGQAFWASAIDAANGNIAAVQAGFSSSAESQALYGNKSNIDKVTSIYVNTFGRQPDAAGLAFWVNQLETGKMTQAQAAWTIQQSAGPIDAAVVQAKLVAAQAFTAQIDTAAEIQGYQGAAAADSARAFLATVTSTATGLTAVAGAATAVATAVAVGGTPGSTFTLTTGVDSFVGGANADTFNGYINTTVGNTTSTLTAADVITGGAGVDTLAITVEGDVGGALPNATINGVEKFSIRDVTTAGASVYDFAAVQGETEVTANSSTRAVSFTSLATGTVVGVKGDGVNTTGAVTFSMAKGTDAVALALNGVKGSAIAATVTGKATSATITTAGAASTTGTITLSDEATAASAGATIKDVTINANADLTIGVAGGGADLIGFDVTNGVTNTITVTGSASKVVLNDVAAAVDVIDASAFAGGVTANANGATLTTFKGGVGADVLTLGALTATGTVDLGAGNDKLLAGAAGVIGANNVIDGGAGVDSISASLINAGNAANIKNFEQLDVSAATVTPLDVDLVTGSTITGLTLNGAGGATLNNVAAGVGLSVGGSSAGVTTIGVKGALTGTADSFGISFDNATAVDAVPTLANVAVNSVVLNGVETVSIASTGVANSWNSIGLTDSKLQTLNITGDKNLDLSFVGAGLNGTNTAVGAGGAVKLIDGSAATGKLSINTTNVTADDKAGVGLTVNGGSAADTITLAQKATVVAGAGNDTIISSVAGGTFTGGAGADKFNVGAAVATGVTEATSVFSTITDFSKTDSLVLGATALTFATTKVTLGAGVTNLDQALAVATTTAGQVSWFQYGANTYVVADEGTGTFGAGDTVVKLSGLVDLSTGTFDAATHALTA